MDKQRQNKLPRSPGRPKGSPNKTTALLKDALLKAAELAGATEESPDGDLVAYLKARAIDTPGPFLALLGKVLPMQVTGADGGNLKQDVYVHIVRPSR